MTAEIMFSLSDLLPMLMFLLWLLSGRKVNGNCFELPQAVWRKSRSHAGTGRSMFALSRKVCTAHNFDHRLLGDFPEDL